VSAARFVKGALRSLVVVGPFAIIAEPAIAAKDPLLIGYMVAVVLFAGLAAAAVDPRSAAMRTGEDRASEAILFLGSFAGILIAGYDRGHGHFSDRVPEPVRVAAFVLLVLGYALRYATIKTNTFFANLLVIQTERGHSVIDRGPYSAVRHPGYLSLLVILPSTALSIGSYAALIPLGLAALRVISRTKKEDAFLLEKLDGYRDYAARVKRRLIPGVW
jgi:protein-S-isoprenylcysteine O-methyltransferase Ste14